MFRASTAGRHLSLESGHGNQDSHVAGGVGLGRGGVNLRYAVGSSRKIVNSSERLSVCGRRSCWGEIRSCHSNWCARAGLGWAGLSIYNTAGHDGVRQ